MLPHDETGRGPAVVLLHAGIADRTMWSEHLEPLAAAGYRVVAFDLPGFGEAVPLPGPQAPWDDVVETMDALGIDRATLVGNSFGAAVALRVAAVAPSRISALVLVSSPVPGLEPSAQLQAAWDAEEAALERDDIEAAVEAVVDAWTLPDAPPSLRERVAAMQRRAFALQGDAVSATEAPDPIGDDLGALATIEAPALVMAGGRDFPDFVGGSESLAGALPSAQLLTLDRAGHLAPLEAPDEFRRAVLGFLQR